MRVEFSKAVKLEMFRRAGGPEALRCEGCGMPLRNKRFDYDHTIECWEMRERRELTAEDGKVLGWDCCHRAKTAAKTTQRAHGDRLIEKAAGIKRGSQKIQGSRGTRWKKHLDGTVSERTDA